MYHSFLLFKYILKLLLLAYATLGSIEKASFLSWVCFVTFLLLVCSYSQISTQWKHFNNLSYYFTSLFKTKDLPMYLESKLLTVTWIWPHINWSCLLFSPLLSYPLHPTLPLLLFLVPSLVCFCTCQPLCIECSSPKYFDPLFPLFL